MGGALPFQAIERLINDGCIKNCSHKNIRPASLDLSITDKIFRIEGIFQPRPGEKIRKILRDIDASPYNLSYPLERGTSYIAKIKEELKLPKSIFAYCSPKSSTGRNDVQVRIVADGVPRYDSVNPKGFSGELWIVIEPKSFPVKLRAGETLSQIRFFNALSRLSEEELVDEFQRSKLIWHNRKPKPHRYSELKIKDGDGTIVLTLGLSSDPVGWECLGKNRVLDFQKRNYYAPEIFYRPLHQKNNQIHLKQGGFYILRTKERVRVPPHLACEMLPMDFRSGEFRAHYAGYIDPGWGYGKNGKGHGRHLVLEIRPFEDIILRDNQPVAKVQFEHMAEVPKIIYDAMKTSNYLSKFEVPKLSKHFSQ